MSSVNNSSQANSDAAPVINHVQFNVPEAAPVASSSNPDSRRQHRRRRDQRATRRFQRAGSMEIEFSSSYEVSLLHPSLLSLSYYDLFRRLGTLTICTQR